jgi:hypothetical protein
VSPDLEHFDPETIADESLRAVFVALLNRCEEQALALANALQENERLQAEICRLKGEHPPRPRGNGPRGSQQSKPPATQHSSEEERRPADKLPRGQRRRQRRAVAVDRRRPLLLNRKDLPADVERKGFVRTLVQDLVVIRRNTEFLREKLYSRRTGRTYLAPLPPGCRGGVGPGLRSFVLQMAYGAHVTFPKIHDFLGQCGIRISRGKVSSLLVHELEALHQECDAVRLAGLESSPWQQLDVTATPVGKQWQACHVLGNPVYSAYRTTERQDRMALLETLCGGAPLRFRVDEQTLQRLERQGVGKRVRAQLRRMMAAIDLEEPALLAGIRGCMPRCGKATLAAIREAAAITAYRAGAMGPVAQCIHGDDAAAFRELTKELSLCWVHDGRHYKKLQSQHEWFRRQVRAFRARYWSFYHELLAYWQAPDPARAAELEAEFDRLFATEVSYAPLAACIARTRANKAKLLLVLRHPELPLHNNDMELAARRRVIKRRVSHGPKTEAGARAWDTMQTLAATTAKLGINFADYVNDRIREQGAIAPLAELIRKAAARLDLGHSWAPT